MFADQRLLPTPHRIHRENIGFSSELRSDLIGPFPCVCHFHQMNFYREDRLRASWLKRMIQFNSSALHFAVATRIHLCFHSYFYLENLRTETFSDYQPPPSFLFLFLSSSISFLSTISVQALFYLPSLRNSNKNSLNSIILLSFLFLLPLCLLNQATLSEKHNLMLLYILYSHVIHFLCITSPHSIQTYNRDPRSI